MSTERRWRWIPRTQAQCALFLLVGIILVGSTVYQMADAGEVAILPIIATVLGAIVIVLATAGLLSPRLRGR